MPPSYILEYHYIDNLKTAIKITNFVIPEGDRRQGKGSTAYNQWEANLPSSVTLIQLFAADTGDGRSNNFWEQMGFDYLYDAFEDHHIDILGTEAAYTMQKGLNGHVVNKISCEQWMDE